MFEIRYIKKGLNLFKNQIPCLECIKDKMNWLYVSTLLKMTQLISEKECQFNY